MIVTIWRHGEAGDAPTDFERPLSSTGEDDVGFGAHQFMLECQRRDLDLPDAILHSPLVRTTLTAEIIAGVFSQASMASEDRLKPGAALEDAVTAIADQTDADPLLRHLLMVSHQPLVSGLINGLLGQEGQAPPLSPGGLVTLEVPFPTAGCAELVFWALPPEYGADR